MTKYSIIYSYKPYMADYNKLLNISTRDSFILKRKQQKKQIHLV